ncbi:hypothetical protein V6Z11_A11G272300 [Gossypium hirsutum]
MVALNLLISLVCCSPSLVLPSHQKPEGILGEFLFLLIFCHRRTNHRFVC